MTPTDDRPTVCEDCGCQCDCGDCQCADCQCASTACGCVCEDGIPAEHVADPTPVPAGSANAGPVPYKGIWLSLIHI